MIVLYNWSELSYFSLWLHNNALQSLVEIISVIMKMIFIVK